MFVALFSACAQTPDDNSTEPVSSPIRPVSRSYDYWVDIAAQNLGFNIMVNGAELLVSHRGNEFKTRIPINDWMISGNNNIDIIVFWPDGIKFAPGISSATFKLFLNDSILKEFRWPLAGPDTQNSYPYTYSETFRTYYFPKVQLEKAERVITSAGTLPRSDQEEIAAIAEQLRKAFREKDINSINDLLKVKYAELAASRFTTSTAVRSEEVAKYRELMGKEGFAVSFNGRNSFFSAADDRAVRLGQGRIGFPEPALVIIYREGGVSRRWEMDLYFAKIDGKWVIIR